MPFTIHTKRAIKISITGILLVVCVNINYNSIHKKVENESYGSLSLSPSRKASVEDLVNLPPQSRSKVVSQLETKGGSFSGAGNHDYHHIINSNKDNIEHVDKKMNKVTIDIISLGTIDRSQYRKAQKVSFGSHPSVRYFFDTAELDEYYPNYHNNDDSTMLNRKDAELIVRRCRPQKLFKRKWPLYNELRSRFASINWLKHYEDSNESNNNPKHDDLSAQKRPIFGLSHALDVYTGKHPPPSINENMRVYTSNDILSNNSSYNHYNLQNHKRQEVQQQDLLPDYLIIIDDDTYLNLDAVTEHLDSAYTSSTEPTVTAGCLNRFPVKQMNFSNPVAGFGTILSRGLLKNLVTPLHCGTRVATETVATTTRHDEEPTKQIKNNYDHDHNDDENFVQTMCKQIMEDQIAEKKFFVEGMSIRDLIFSYVNPAESILDWKKSRWPYCLHSDWVWGYFFNYYNVSTHLGDRAPQVSTDRIGAYGGSTIYNGRQTSTTKAQRRQCNNINDYTCRQKSHICHNVSPKKMLTLAGIESSVSILAS